MKTKRTVSLLAFAMTLIMLSVTMVACMGGGGRGAETTTQQPFVPNPMTAQTTPNQGGSEPNQSTDPNQTTDPTQPTDPVQSTTPPVTDPPVTTPAVTDPPETDPPVTTDPPNIVDPVEPPTPSANATVVEGTIKGDSGANLILYLDWKAVQEPNADTMYVTCKISLKYYSMYKSASRGEITVNGQTIPFTTPLIDEVGIEGSRIADFATVTFAIENKAGQDITLDLSAKWYFGGTYSGKTLEWITLSGKTAVTH